MIGVSSRCIHAATKVVAASRGAAASFWPEDGAAPAGRAAMRVTTPPAARVKGRVQWYSSVPPVPL